MKRDPLKIVVLEESAVEAERLMEPLRKAGLACELVWAGDRERFVEILNKPAAIDLVLARETLPHRYGLDPFAAREALQFLRERDPATPFILLVDHEDPALALDALRRGMTDVVPRTTNGFERMAYVAERALREARLRIERRQAESALLAAELRLGSLFDLALDALVVIQAVTGTVLKSNRAVFTLLGYEESTILGKHFSFLFPDKAALPPQEFLVRLRTTGPVFQSQPFLRADGTICPMDVTAALLPWGNSRAILTTLRDVTERDWREETCRRHAFAIDHAPELIFWADADGRFCDVNETACRRLGYRREELMGQPLAMIDPALGADLWPIHWEELRRSESFPLQSMLRCRDGAPLAVSAMIHHFTSADQEYHCAIAMAAGGPMNNGHYNNNALPSLQSMEPQPLLAERMPLPAITP